MSTTGFEYHFAKGIPSGMINSATWRAYLAEDDLEREKVGKLRFGYPMIRLNGFNLGNNPVAIIDSMLRERLESILNGNEPHDLVKRDAAKATEIEEGLKTGDYKRCKKCDRDLPVKFFRDSGTKSGFGRLCPECKATMPSTSSRPRFGRRYRRW